MADRIQVTLQDGSNRECPLGTSVYDLMQDTHSLDGLAYLGALVNNDMVSLSYPLEVDSEVIYLTMADSHGWHIYRQSLAFLLAMTVKELFPKARLYVEHSLGTGFYCNFEENGSTGITEERIAAIETHMRRLIDMDMPIKRQKIFYSEAIRHFERERQFDKCNLLRFRNPPKIVVYRCGEFIEISHGPLAYNTGALPHFKLIPYSPGFMLQFPDRENPPDPAPFEPQPQLFQIFKEYKQWGRILGVRTAGDLNEIIARNAVKDFVMIAEALHEKKLARIADHVYQHRQRIKWILIAGPSSSGKTTFAQRLAVQLRVNGLRPVTISVDNYFRNRAETPLTPDGEYDFEHIETIDLDLFNEHLLKLDRGEEVDMPIFDFETGQRSFNGHQMRVDDAQMVLIEGIHSLNPRLSETLPAERKFKIYISALTQLNLDFSTRISTTDNRLVRRIVRDHQFRGHSALKTIKMWPNVRNGEKKWIFPYQSESNIAFNSALDYELAMLKPRVEPLLAEVKPYHPEYATARRLMEFLSGFISAPSSSVPRKSILREFIGPGLMF